MEQTKEFALTLDDRPGTLAKATDAIAKAGVNIEGYCAVPSGKDGKGTFRVVTSDPATTRKALETAGFKVQEERDVAIIDAEDRPGFLAQTLRRLADNELNVGRPTRSRRTASRSPPTTSRSCASPCRNWFRPRDASRDRHSRCRPHKHFGGHAFPAPATAQSPTS